MSPLLPAAVLLAITFGESVDRKEFLSILGMSAAAVACSYCLGGCKTGDNPVSAPANVDFTLDLTNPAYAALKTNGGYLYNAGVIVARTSAGGYVAVSQSCTHAGANVVFAGSSNQFQCPAHGSIFASDGSVVRGPAGSPLGKYNTSLSGNLLRVYS
jgi:cytochrome b6-f complex iron-sulfur subunit